MTIIAVANQKGGAGKTTTAVNLAGVWAAEGARVLLLDCDPQGGSTASLGVDAAGLPTPRTYWRGLRSNNCRC